jgi:hypothetical protein
VATKVELQWTARNLGEVMMMRWHLLDLRLRQKIDLIYQGERDASDP